MQHIHIRTHILERKKSTRRKKCRTGINKVLGLLAFKKPKIVYRDIIFRTLIIAIKLGV
jgi:hypothetical protein